MILKIGNGRGRTGWHIYEGNKIRWFVSTMNEELDWYKCCDDMVLKDHSSDSFDRECVVIAYISNRGDEFEYSIVFDVDAYICNDKGNTIDKITI